MGTLCLHEKEKPTPLGNEQSLWWCVHVEGSFSATLSPSTKTLRRTPDRSEAFLAHGVLGVGTGPSC